MFYNKTYKAILENYKSIKTITRHFYPRNFTLSDEFVKAFQKECARLRSLNIDDRRIIQKITKALPFHKQNSAE